MDQKIDTQLVTGKLILEREDESGDLTKKAWRFPKKQQPPNVLTLEDYAVHVLISVVKVISDFFKDCHQEPDLWMANMLYRVAKTVYTMASDFEVEHKKGPKK